MKLQLAPNLSIEGDILPVPVENIIGLPAGLVKAKGSEVVCPFPIPISRRLTRNMYQFIHQISWDKDLLGSYSHIQCFVIVDSLGQEIINEASIVMDAIHVNRAQKKISDAIRGLEQSPQSLDIIKKSYGIDKLGDISKLFAQGLISDRSIRRIANSQNKKRTQNISDIEPNEGMGKDQNSKNTKSKKDIAINLWDNFRLVNHNVWTFDQITHASRWPEQTEERLVELILKNPKNLH